MTALFALVLAASPQQLLKAELVRVDKGSAVVLTFKKPVDRRSIPVVPNGNRLTLKLPVAAPAHLTGQREPIGMVRSIRIKGRRLQLRLNQDAKAVANKGVVLARRRLWYLRLVDPTASRDLADVLHGSASARDDDKNPYEPIALPPVKISATPPENTVTETTADQETTEADVGSLAAVAAAARGEELAGGGESAGDGTAEAIAPPPPKGGLGHWLRIGAGGALLVFGLLGFFLYRRRKDDYEEAFGLKVVSRARLDAKSSVAVLEVGGAVLVVGLSDAGPTLLTRLDEQTGQTQDDELGRLRRLVVDDPATRLGSWLAHARPESTTKAATATRPEPGPPPVAAAAAASGSEADDLKRRLAEIRMKVG